MMINKKNCSLIVLLVLVAFARSSESIFSRLTKRSTDDGACEHTTTEFCFKIINDDKGLLQRFHPDVSHQIRNHYKNATANCKVLLCAMTMYAVIVEGEKYFPNLPFINDEAFINVIKDSSLADCIDNKNNYNTDDSHTRHTEEIYTATTATIDDKSYTTDSSSNIDFNQFATATTQQDTQSIKSNEIDGSLNESKHEPRKGIIDILYTNENYTNAAKYVNELTDTEGVENNPAIENVAVVNLDELGTDATDSTPPHYTSASGENERFDLDVANRILGIRETTRTANEDTVSTSQFVFDSSLITSTSIPIDSIDAEQSVTSTVSDLSNNDITVDETKRILTFESSTMPTTTNTSALSHVGNIIFQLLGEEGYNSFSCNLTTADEDYTSYVGDNTMYRRTNKLHQSNPSLDKNAFQASDSESLPKIPADLRNDDKIKFLLLEFRIFELCNFTGEHHDNQIENVSKKLALCSNEISKLKIHVHGKTKTILEQYSKDLIEAAKKFNGMQESRMKIIKIINLTDYLSSTIKDTDIPKDMKGNFHDLKEFLLVELRNEDLSTFHPDSNQKDTFMIQLFDYLIQSKIVDNKKKKLLEMFRKFIRIVS
ncbi:uncharacterized protein LOC119083059 isoform X1 [Bradysia coprophila]|uniref:uncharacterized protein LOC119083059 isoform X1 n=2 Tax=Bradysia coprophila TaxID=38358 RepID=UPI00187D9B60|nr:uncharacterized protein LOC119083059 isoform X1 [Bradysia coprophila]